MRATFRTVIRRAISAQAALFRPRRLLLGAALSAVFVSTVGQSISGHPQVDGSELELVQVQVITRHGARVPLASNKLPQSIAQLPWVCDDIYEDNKQDLLVQREGATTEPEKYDEYKKQFLHSYGREKMFGGSCVDGQLTLVGEHQMEDFGHFLRERYVNSVNLLPERYDPTRLWVRSTNTSRTVNTAHRVVMGLYPADTRSPNDQVVVHIRNPALEDMYPRSGCARLNELKAELKGRSDGKEGSRQRQQIFDRIQEDSERLYWSTRSTMGSTNILDSFEKHGFTDKLPAGLSKDSYQVARQISGRYYYNTYSSDDAARLGIGQFVGDLARVVERAVQRRAWSAPENPTKLFLYSGHDNTIGPLLHAFKVSDGHHPAMGSAILLEIYRHPKTQKHYFQLLFFEGKLHALQMPSCSSSVCEIDKFMERAHRLTPLDYSAECGMATELVQSE